MPQLEIEPGESLYYTQAEPARSGAPSFLFVNALTGSADAWEAVVAPALREEGFGTLSYEFRGQGRSSFRPETALTPELIVSDLRRLIEARLSAPPILVGLSIGGLFAAQAHLAGAPAAGLALLNTLREIGPRLAWVNDAMPLIVGAGGVPLFMDAMLPLLVNEEYLRKARSGALSGAYAPLDPAHGHANLMRHAGAADWDLPYERLTLPTLVITGQQDRVFLDREVVNRLFKRLPDARAEAWEDAGHLLPQERPEQLARSLLRFGREIEQKGVAA